MRILIVDYLCQKGHKNYVSILLDSLVTLGHDVTFITSKDFMDYLCVDDTRINTITYKAESFKARPRLNNIIYQIYSLKKIEWKLREKKFDYIILTSYNIYSYFFFKRKEITFIINHDNIDRINHGYTLFLHRHLSNNNRYVVLSPYIKSYVEKILSNKKVVYVPHGVTRNLQLSCDSLFAKYPHIIFCSARSSCNEEFLGELLADKDNQEFLEKNNILLIVRTNYKYNVNIKNVMFIDSSHRIADLDYDYIINHALCVYLPYAEDFRYRVSGIFYECIPNNIPVLFNETDSTVQYEDFVTYNYVFSDPKEFKDRVSTILNSCSGVYYKNITLLDPKLYWKNILV